MKVGDLVRLFDTKKIGIIVDIHPCKYDAEVDGIEVMHSGGKVDSFYVPQLEVIRENR